MAASFGTAATAVVSRTATRVMYTGKDRDRSSADHLQSASRSREQGPPR